MKETRERERERGGRTQFISVFDGVEEVKQCCESRIRADNACVQERHIRSVRSSEFKFALFVVV
jgi:hypothetical protein